MNPDCREFTLTAIRYPVRLIPGIASRAISRPFGFSATATESSRSRQTMSAPASGAFSMNRSLIAGTNRALRISRASDLGIVGD